MAEVAVFTNDLKKRQQLEYGKEYFVMAAMDYSQVAHWYDIYVNTELDVPFFLNEAQNSKRVLELTSGTGRLSIPLLEAGVSLTCVDNSPEMLAILHQKVAAKGLSANIYEMDMCNLTLQEKFELIIIPFNSFSEILRIDEQRQALKGIRNCLTETGRFICTLHNPSIRLKSVNKQLMFRGKYSLPHENTMFLWSVEECTLQNSLVKGTQFWEVYTRNGEMQRKSFLDIQFYLHQQSEFQKLAESQNFHLINLYGDYSYSEFQKETSPFMIWVLGKDQSR
ncbi:MAG: class I SAM-dependent methyltransferase [Xenococcaceae cyanobacterium MO_167.B27]|nr:class I SAM-dependent methyltransferase [Xenococcaceae cyanobacterium MO_167.B27]